MRIHVVAVSGTGMGALAGLLAELGHELSGSDVQFDPPIGPALESWGVRCLPGFDPRHLEPPPELVVVGNVCRKDNPEVVSARERSIPYTHLPGALARFALSGTSPFVVAGTHGKTTTSSLAAWLLEAAGRAPGFLIGGIPKNFGRSFRSARAADQKTRLGLNGGRLRASPFVLEGDEYDTAFFEKTPKFLHYPVEVAILTSIEHDHIDVYATFEEYLDAFRKFVARVPENGLLVANAADPRVVEIVTGHARAPVAWYALEGDPTHDQPPHWLAAPASEEQHAQRFDLYAGGVYVGRFALPLSGRHNLGNATAALAAVAQGYGARLAELVEPLARFAGVSRRQDLLGTPRGVFVYDDFAHHPTAVKETLLGLRSRHPLARLIAVFEPRSATACRNLHQAQYASCFEAADDVLLAPLGRSGLPRDEQLDLERLSAELRERGKRAEPCASIDAIIEAVAERAEAGSVVALLSNGAFGGIHKKLIAALSSERARGDGA